MSTEVYGWIDSVWACLRQIPIGNAAAALELAWQNHLARKKPVAAIFGVYDAGKTSLLKRLLFEDGVEVPFELTVSGRRETFTVTEIDGADWTFRDGPGLAGGNPEHELQGLESLELADLLVWVLPPQLVTSNKEVFESIAAGVRFDVTTDIVGTSQIVVLSRMEEAGIDPADNLDGFRDLCERKKTEFLAILRTMGAAAPRWGCHTVCPDPYQGVGNNSPDAATYAMGVGWDGIPELRKVLTDAASHAEELRALSGYRFASRNLANLVATTREERQQREEAITTCDNELERVSLWCANFANLRRKCEADLHRIIEDELLSAGRTGSAANAEALRKGLADAIDRWSDQAYSEFEHLAAAADQEVGQRLRSPAMEHLKQFISEISESESESESENRGGDGKVRARVGLLGKAFRESFKNYARLDTGMSMDEAAKKVREFNESGMSWGEFRKAKRGETFASEEMAKRASEYVKWSNVLDVCAPLAEQLGPLLFDIGGEVLSAKQAEKKAHRRRELRDRLREESLKVEQEAMKGFDEMSQSFCEWLTRLEDLHRPSKDALEIQVSELRRYESELDRLSSQRPVLA